MKGPYADDVVALTRKLAIGEAMKKDHDLVDIDDIDYVRETDGAFLVRDSDEKEHWIPKSKVEYDKDSKTFTMPEWLALDRGFV